MLKYDNGEVNPSVRNDKCLFFIGCKHLREAFKYCFADSAKIIARKGYPQDRPKQVCQFWSKNTNFTLQDSILASG